MYENYIYIISLFLFLPPTLPISLISFQMCNPLILNFTNMRMYTQNMHLYNLLGPFTVTNMYICLWLITWHWITYQRYFSPSWESLIAWHSLSSNGILWDSSSSIAMSTGVIVQVWLRFNMHNFSVLSRRHYLTDVLVLRPLQSFCTLLCDILWALGVGAVF